MSIKKFTYNGDTLEVDNDNVTCNGTLLTIVQLKGLYPEDRVATMQLANEEILDLAIHLLNILEISRSN